MDWYKLRFAFNALLLGFFKDFSEWFKSITDFLICPYKKRYAWVEWTCNAHKFDDILGVRNGPHELITSVYKLIFTPDEAYLFK